MHSAPVHVGALVVAIGLLGCAGPEPGAADESQPPAERSAPLRSLPQVRDLPSNYRAVGELAGRGMFYAATERPAFRIDDGNHYHGYAGPGVWAQESKGTRTQGVLYGVDDGAIVSAGYLIRQADLVSGKSLHGLTLRELDFPVAYSMTADLIEGETAESNQYLWLWHFTPPDDAVPSMLTTGQLPPRHEPTERIPSGRVRPRARDPFLSGNGTSFHRSPRPGHRPDVQSPTDRSRR